MTDTEAFLLSLIDRAGEDMISVEGDCQHCKTRVVLDVDLVSHDTVEVNGNGGMKYYVTQGKPAFICSDCHDKGLRLGTPCEVFSRVCGYLRPVKNWNPGKKEEFQLRTTFNTEPELVIPTV